MLDVKQEAINTKKTDSDIVPSRQGRICKAHGSMTVYDNQVKLGHLASIFGKNQGLFWTKMRVSKKKISNFEAQGPWHFPKVRKKFRGKGTRPGVELSTSDGRGVDIEEEEWGNVSGS